MQFKCQLLARREGKKEELLGKPVCKHDKQPGLSTGTLFVGHFTSSYFGNLEERLCWPYLGLWMHNSPVRSTPPSSGTPGAKSEKGGVAPVKLNISPGATFH